MQYDTSDKRQRFFTILFTIFLLLAFFGFPLLADGASSELKVTNGQQLFWCHGSPVDNVVTKADISMIERALTSAQYIHHDKRLTIFYCFDEHAPLKYQLTIDTEDGSTARLYLNPNDSSLFINDLKKDINTHLIDYGIYSTMEGFTYSNFNPMCHDEFSDVDPTEPALYRIIETTLNGAYERHELTDKYHVEFCYGSYMHTGYDPSTKTISIIVPYDYNSSNSNDFNIFFTTFVSEWAHMLDIYQPLPAVEYKIFLPTEAHALLNDHPYNPDNAFNFSVLVAAHPERFLHHVALSNSAKDLENLDLNCFQFVGEKLYVNFDAQSRYRKTMAKHTVMILEVNAGCLG